MTEINTEAVVTAAEASDRPSFAALDSIEALRDDWLDNADLTSEQVAALNQLPAAEVQRVLTANACMVEDRFYQMLDSVRGDTTRQLLRALESAQMADQ